MSLHVKYRPTTFEEVKGNSAVVKSFAKAVARRDTQAFILSGESGVGKTTLARIAAKALGCEDRSIKEVNAATSTGIDDMRAILEMLYHKGFGKRPERAIIIDEAHGLSKQAWDSLLKDVEEPPKHVYWFFCTTNAAKIPATIRTRCHSSVLKLVDEDVISELLIEVAESESFTCDDEIVALCAREARGSLRQALVNLSACRDAKGKKEAARILETVLDSNPVIELCRFLLKGGTWPTAMNHFEALENEPPESVRIIVCRYFAKVAQGAKGDQNAQKALHMLDSFATPYHPAEGNAPLMLSIGRALFQG